MAPKKEVMKKGTDSGTTWTAFLIEYVINILCAFWEI